MPKLHFLCLSMTCILIRFKSNQLLYFKVTVAPVKVKGRLFNGSQPALSLVDFDPFWQLLFFYGPLIVIVTTSGRANKKKKLHNLDI